jgi:hypothetical protein
VKKQYFAWPAFNTTGTGANRDRKMEDFAGSGDSCHDKK